MLRRCAPRNDSGSGGHRRGHRLARLSRCCPAASKFAGSSQRSKAARSAGHSLSMIENHVVSRLRPLCHCLAEQPLVLEAEPQRRRPRRRVQRIAFPFVAPIAEFVEHAAIIRNIASVAAGVRCRSGAVVDAADLDDADGRVDAHVRRDADRLAGRVVDDRVEQRVVGPRRRLGPPRYGRDRETGPRGR